MKKLICMLTVLVLAFGCDGGTVTSPAPPNWDVTGTWNGTMTGATATDFTLDLAQIDSNITGTMTNNLAMTFDVNGSQTGDIISLTAVEVPASGYSVNITGSTVDGFIADGTWNDSIGQNGTWNAVKN